MTLPVKSGKSHALRNHLSGRDIQALGAAEKCSILAAHTAETHAASALRFLQPLWGGSLDQTEFSRALEARMDAVNEGDLSHLESMLVGHAAVTDAMFHELARRSNATTDARLMESYMRLAFKAQSQCRTAIDSLVEMKNPRSVAFVKQANIAQTQQVNNGEALVGRAEVMQSEPNELQRQPIRRLAFGASPEGGGVDPSTATVVEVHRPKNRRGKGQG